MCPDRNRTRDPLVYGTTNEATPAGAMSGFFCSIYCFGLLFEIDSVTLLCVSVVHSFCFLSNVPLNEYIAFVDLLSY